MEQQCDCCQTLPSEASANFQGDFQVEDIQDSFCVYSCYPHLNPSTAEMSFDPAPLGKKEIRSGEAISTKADGRYDESIYMHEFLVRAILDFQSDMKKPETITEPFRSVPEGSVLKPPITFLRKCITKK
jgi:hypothetical protein